MKRPIPVQTQRSGFWSGTLFGVILGISSLLTYQFLSGILKATPPDAVDYPFSTRKL